MLLAHVQVGDVHSTFLPFMQKVTATVQANYPINEENSQTREECKQQLISTAFRHLFLSLQCLFPLEHLWCSSRGSQAPRGPAHSLHKSSWHLGGQNDSFSQFCLCLVTCTLPGALAQVALTEGSLSRLTVWEVGTSLFQTRRNPCRATPDTSPCHQQKHIWTMAAALPAGLNAKCHFAFLQRMSDTQWEPEAHRSAKENVWGSML